MASLNGKATRKNLLKKGFKTAPGDHYYFEFWHNNICVARTFTSRNDQDIYDPLIKAMSNQCKVPVPFFKEFAKCTKTQTDYINVLKEKGYIE